MLWMQPSPCRFPGTERRPFLPHPPWPQLYCCGPDQLLLRGIGGGQYHLNPLMASHRQMHGLRISRNGSQRFCLLRRRGPAACQQKCQRAARKIYFLIFLSSHEKNLSFSFHTVRLIIRYRDGQRKKKASIPHSFLQKKRLPIVKNLHHAIPIRFAAWKRLQLLCQGKRLPTVHGKANCTCMVRIHQSNPHQKYDS